MKHTVYLLMCFLLLVCGFALFVGFCIGYNQAKTKYAHIEVGPCDIVSTPVELPAPVQEKHWCDPVTHICH